MASDIEHDNRARRGAAAKTCLIANDSQQDNKI